MTIIERDGRWRPLPLLQSPVPCGAGCERRSMILGRIRLTLGRIVIADGQDLNDWDKSKLFVDTRPEYGLSIAGAMHAGHAVHSAPGRGIGRIDPDNVFGDIAQAVAVRAEGVFDVTAEVEGDQVTKIEIRKIAGN